MEIIYKNNKRAKQRGLGLARVSLIKREAQAF
jgi:hypothetical protein